MDISQLFLISKTISVRNARQRSSSGTLFPAQIELRGWSVAHVDHEKTRVLVVQQTFICWNIHVNIHVTDDSGVDLLRALRGLSVPAPLAKAQAHGSFASRCKRVRFAVLFVAFLH